MLLAYYAGGRIRMEVFLRATVSRLISKKTSLSKTPAIFQRDSLLGFEREKQTLCLALTNFVSLADFEPRASNSREKKTAENQMTACRMLCFSIAVILRNERV